MSILRVSVFGTIPMRPARWLRGITGYLLIDKSFFYVFGSYESKVLTSPNNYMTLSSWRISSWPFKRKTYSRPSSPVIESLLGCCLLWKTFIISSNLAIFIIFLPLLKVPGTATCKLVLARRRGATFLNS